MSSDVQGGRNLQTSLFLIAHKVGILSTEEKHLITSGIRQRYPNDSEDQLRITEALRGGYVVILKTLGEKWVEKNIAPKADSSDAGFMKRGLSRKQDRFEHVDRIIMLAEFIHSLWELPNFQSSKLKDLQTKSLEETFFELQIARSLLRRELLINFVVPSGQRGKDYDLNAAIQNQSIAVEIKCRIGDQSFSDNKLTDPLKHAARVQLPKEGPGVIFIKLSAPWMYDPSFLERANGLVENFLRNYSRVNAVFLHWEEWRHLGAFARLSAFKSYISPAPKRDVPGIERFDTGRDIEYCHTTNLPISYI